MGEAGIAHSADAVMPCRRCPASSFPGALRRRERPRTGGSGDFQIGNTEPLCVCHDDHSPHDQDGSSPPRHDPRPRGSHGSPGGRRELHDHRRHGGAADAGAPGAQGEQLQLEHRPHPGRDQDRRRRPDAGGARADPDRREPPRQRHVRLGDRPARVRTPGRLVPASQRRPHGAQQGARRHHLGHRHHRRLRRRARRPHRRAVREPAHLGLLAHRGQRDRARHHRLHPQAVPHLRRRPHQGKAAAAATAAATATATATATTTATTAATTTTEVTR